MYKEKIIDVFGKPLLYPLSAMRDEDIFKRFLDRVGKVDTIVETGTCNGISCLLLSDYAKKVYTLDVVDYPLKYEIWDMFSKKNIVFHLIKNEDEKKKILGELNFQFAFLDGSHSGVAIDFELTMKCGKILFHDYQTGFPPENCRSYVVRFVNSLKGIVEIEQPFAYWETEKVLS